MKINANQLSSHLQNNLATCYLVTGDEHLLVDEALDAVREAARNRGFASRDLHVATQGFDWKILRESTANLSLFAEKRIVELRLPTGKPGRTGSAAIVDLVATADSELLFIVSGPKLDKSTLNSKWAKTIDAKGVSLQLWPIGVRELPAWIADRMRRAGLDGDRDAVRLIAERVEGNLLAAQQEIEKLRLILGEGKVTVDDVSNAVADSSRYDVFKLVDSALSGDTKRALRILSGLRAEGVEPVVVVWALTRELRMLALLSDTIAQGADLASGMQRTGVWRNRQAIVRSCIGRHQHGDFHRLLKAANAADQAAKGQSYADPWQLSTDIVLGISTR